MLTKTTVDPALALGLEVAMLRAPRLVPEASWRVRVTDGGVEIHDPAASAHPDHPTCVSYGMATEFLVLALHEAGLSATVDVGDPIGSGQVARVDAAESAPPSGLDMALFEAATSRHWPTELVLPNDGSSSTAYQRDILMMAAASQRVEFVWLLPIAPGQDRQAIVSATDDPVDWFRAGRAAAHIMLRAATLDLTAELVTPSLRQAQLREAISKELRPLRYPQVFLQVTRGSSQEPDAAALSSASLGGRS